MITVTERAKELLLEKKLSANIDHPEVGLRLATDADGRWKLFTDRPKARDQVVEHRGSKVLFVDPETSAILVGMKVDCRQTADGRAKLVIRSSGS